MLHLNLLLVSHQWHQFIWFTLCSSISSRLTPNRIQCDSRTVWTDSVRFRFCERLLIQPNHSNDPTQKNDSFTIRIGRRYYNICLVLPHETPLSNNYQTSPHNKPVVHSFGCTDTNLDNVSFKNIHVLILWILNLRAPLIFLKIILLLSPDTQTRCIHHTQQPKTADSHCLEIWSDQQFNNIMINYILLAMQSNVMSKENEIKISVLSFFVFKFPGRICVKKASRSRQNVIRDFIKCTMICFCNVILKVHIPVI